MPPNPEAGQGKARLGFDHDIRFVNKIKTTFSEDPQIYKSFLGNLAQLPEREEIDPAGVPGKSSLFNNQPELLEEFAQFLPEAGAEHLAAQANKQAARSAHCLIS